MEKRKFRIMYFAVHGILLAGLGLFVGSATLIRRFLPDYRCTLAKYVGLYCPGCGGTRSVFALLSLKPIEAFLSFPPILVILFSCVFWEVKALLRFKTGDAKYTEGINRPLFWIVVAVLLWFVLHNVLLLFGYDYLGDILK